jgi:cellulose synthase/poly-beta-1,6-N-acetylglucosamine synthase-like glycosyltransferase
VKIVLWLSLAGILYTYLGYPVVMWILARVRSWSWKVAPVTPSVSVVLAVHDGIALLPRKIQHLLALDYPNIHEIILVSDGSTDGTAELLVAQTHPLIKSVVLQEHAGKAVAVNAGVAKATADVILFVDIRPEIAPGAIQELVSNFADPKVGCVAGELNLRQENHDATSAAVGGLYWRYEQWIRKCESAFDSPVGVYGGFYAVRRSLAVQQPAGMILDDMFQPLSIIRQGYRSVLDVKACVYDTWPKTVAGEFHRKVRTLAGNFQLFQIAPWSMTPQNRVLFQLISHKLMRLLAPYLMLMFFVSSLALSGGSRAYAGLAALQIFVWSLAIVGLRFRIPVLHRISAPASMLLMLNAAAVVGFYKFLTARGQLWKIWNSSGPKPPGSAAASAAPQDSAAVDFGESLRKDANQQAEGQPAITASKVLLLVLVGAGVAIASLLFQSNIVKVAAAKTEHIAPPVPYFPSGAIWTQDISHAPLDPQSSTMITWLAGAGGWGHGRMQVDFAIRVLQADASTPHVPFHKGQQFYSPDSDLVATIPLPAGGGLEGQSGYNCPVNEQDCHLIVVDRGQGKLYEAWQAIYTDNILSATALAVWDLNRVYPPSGRGDQCTSADAAGFPIAPLLFNADELASGSINHAIRFILPNPRMRAHFFVHPATHAGAPHGPDTAPPYGAHFRLKASYNLSHLKPAARIVARAMQKYGMFLADGGNVALTAQSDADTKTKYADVDFGSRDLQSLQVTDFEVVDGGTPIQLTDNCVRNP